ncbi:MAG TPA: FliH/SctL family protein [Microvirga sp.]|nr:FliH/SctL family protein [Microvirga sp.]
MTNAAKFLFDTDFRQRAPNPKTTAAVEEAEARGYMRGLNDGQRQAQAAAQAHLAAAMERLAQSAAMLLGEADRHGAETEALAVDFAVALGRKLAGDALALDPLATIAATARETFQHLRGVPHLAVRVNESLVEEVDALLQRMARERGFEGRLITFGDPDIRPGDIRLEWADGGVVRDQARIEEAVHQALVNSFSASDHS